MKHSENEISVSIQPKNDVTHAYVVSFYYRMLYGVVE